MTDSLEAAAVRAVGDVESRPVALGRRPATTSMLTTGPRLLDPRLPRAAGAREGRSRRSAVACANPRRACWRCGSRCARFLSALTRQPLRVRPRTLRYDRGPEGAAFKVNEHATSLAREWRRLGRAATAVALLTSPALFVLFCTARYGWPLASGRSSARSPGSSSSAALVDVIAHRLIPSPSLYGAEAELREARRHLAAPALVLEAQAAPAAGVGALLLIVARHRSR